MNKCSVKHTKFMQSTVAQHYDELKTIGAGFETDCQTSGGMYG